MSSTKNILHQYNLLSNAAATSTLSATGLSNFTLSSTSLIYSQPVRVTNLDNIGIQATWKPGTPTGSFFLDGSVNYIQDAQGNVTQAGDWVTSDSTGKWALSSGTQSSTSIFQALGTTGTFIATINQVPIDWIRMRYVPSSASSSGVLNLWVTGKQI